jgi:hypothetical protein
VTTESVLKELKLQGRVYRHQEGLRRPLEPQNSL